MNRKKRYAVCGVSTRAIHMWIKNFHNNYKQSAELVAMLDMDPLRFQVCREIIPTIPESIPGYAPGEFDEMVEKTRPDVIIVAGVDRTHVTYILKALEHDLDVITEKPMCTTYEDCERVLEAEKRSKGKVICTFNYRYAPAHRRIRELVLAGKTGRVTHVDLTWYIDTRHGSSYFNRWNRMRENSGGLSIHKSSHHFDLVNWWLDDIPAAVHAFGDRYYYGSEGPLNPGRKDGRICSTCGERLDCRYYARWATRNSTIEAADDHLGGFDGKNGSLFTNYSPDMCIFDSEINIHDAFVVNVRYKSGAILNYSANFSTPYEGYRLAINGTLGRIETESWGKARPCYPMEYEKQHQAIDYYPLFGSRERILLPEATGGHGGGDPLIMEDIFLGPDPRHEYKILADSTDAARAIAIGDAVWHSIKEETVVKLTVQ